MSKRKPMTNTEFVEHMMTFSNYGALAQLFVLDAIGKFADRVAASKPEDYPADGFVNPESWIGVAKEIKHKIANRT